MEWEVGIAYDPARRANEPVVNIADAEDGDLSISMSPEHARILGSRLIEAANLADILNKTGQKADVAVGSG
jgi:hypothetical protein